MSQNEIVEIVHAQNGDTWNENNDQKKQKNDEDFQNKQTEVINDSMCQCVSWMLLVL